MCGIAGIYKKRSGKSKNASLSSSLKSAFSHMKHRGPDDTGTWISKEKYVGFIQTRLSIVDPKPRSKQPMSTPDGRYTINFNGEIYNYIALRELVVEYNLQTTSDTEILLYSYIKFGKAILQKLEGMYAFTIYDEKTNELFCARDVVGQKPFVYSQTSDGFYFASEIPALLSLSSSISKEIDVDAIKLYCTSNFNHIPAPFTAYKHIRKLLPAHYMVVKDGSIVEYKPYFKLSKTLLSKKSNSQPFGSLFGTICEEMKPRDVTYASLLSGGNDSSLVCAHLGVNGEKVHTYTLQIHPQDADYKRSVYAAKHLNCKHTVIPFTPSGFFTSVTSQVETLGEPYFHTTSVYADYLFAHVKRDHKVIFTGAGGDELYYGYDNRLFLAVTLYFKLKQFVPEVILQHLLPKRYRFASQSSVHTFKPQFYLSEFDSIKSKFAKTDSTGVKKYFATLADFMNTIVDAKSYLDVTYMYGLFVENSHSLTIQSDLVGMKNSLEVRCPFLEKRLLEHAYRLPWYKKIRLSYPKEGKKPIRHALLKFFPSWFVYASKKGFGVDFSGTKDLVLLNSKKLLESLSIIEESGIFSKQYIQKLKENPSEWNFVEIYKLHTIATWLHQQKM